MVISASQEFFHSSQSVVHRASGPTAVADVGMRAPSLTAESRELRPTSCGWPAGRMFLFCSRIEASFPFRGRWSATRKYWAQFDYARLDGSDEADRPVLTRTRWACAGRAAFKLSRDSGLFAALQAASRAASWTFAEDLNGQSGDADVLKLFHDYSSDA